MAIKGERLGIWQLLSLFTPKVAFLTIYLSLGTLNFGYDIGVFNGLQGIPPFTKRFGEYNPKQDAFVLPGYLASIMNGVPYLGKLVGSIMCGPIGEKYGRRPTVAIMCSICLVGVVLQTSATTAAQFLVGRVITYIMTGFVLVIIPIYQAECSPAAIRGLASSIAQLQIVLGLIIASLVNLGTNHMNSDAAWQVPVGVQLIIPSIMLALLPLIPESPRWLLAKGRIEQAKQSLSILRHKSAEDSVIADEIDCLREAHGNANKGPWKEVFNARNRMRTFITVMAGFFQQFTGQSFIGQYSVSFYKTNRIANPFLLNVLQNIAASVASILASLVVDNVGRRYLLLGGGLLMASFLTILGSVGTISSPNESHKNTMAASMILAYSFFELSWAPIGFILVGEVPSSRVKEKTTDLAISMGVIATFLVSFTVPYLVNEEYANLGAKVGFIYGGITFVSMAVAYFFVPELKGLSLEEVDRLFESPVPVRKLRRTVLDQTDERVERIVEAEKGTITP